MTAVSSSSSELEEGELPPSPSRPQPAATKSTADSAQRKAESTSGHRDRELSRDKNSSAREHEHTRTSRLADHSRSYSPAHARDNSRASPHKQRNSQRTATLEQQAADSIASAKRCLGRLGLKDGLKAPEEFFDQLWKAVSILVALVQQKGANTSEGNKSPEAQVELGALLRNAYRSLKIISETGAARTQVAQSSLVRKAVELTWRRRDVLFTSAHRKEVERCICDSKVFSSWIAPQSKAAEAASGTARQADGSTVQQNGLAGSRKRQRLASADSSVVPSFISLTSKASRSVLSPSTPSPQRKTAEHPPPPPAPRKGSSPYADTPERTPARPQLPSAPHKEGLEWYDTPLQAQAEAKAGTASHEHQTSQLKEGSTEPDNLYEVLFTSPSSLSGSGAEHPAAANQIAVHKNGLPRPATPVSPGPQAPVGAAGSMPAAPIANGQSHRHVPVERSARPYAIPAGTMQPSSAPASPMDIVPDNRSRSSTPLQPPAAIDALLRQGKLCLILDLDHTLVNSARFSEVDEQTQQKLEQRRLDQELAPLHERELFRLDHISMWTKLRPAVRTFLQTASQFFQLWIHTNGNRTYAQAIASLLDPHGSLFGPRIIASGAEDGSTAMNSAKRLMQGLEELESCALVVDDTTSVWEHHKDSLLAVERYVFFPSSHQTLNMPGQSFLETNRDEHGSHGQLMVAVGVLVRVHKRVFGQLNGKISVRLPGRDAWDARAALWTERSKILAGVVILFSGLFPVGDKEPQQQKLWLQAERFGARCVAEKQDDVTHVVGKQSGTEKVHWATQRGKFVVTKAWLECSCVLWKRAVEANFSLISLVQLAI